MRDVAVFGLGRSGLAVARAARAKGAKVIVFDQSTLDDLPKRDVATEGEREGIIIHYGWDGDLNEVPENAMLVVNPAVDHRHPILRDAVSLGMDVISEVEFAYRISQAPIVAITGTNGKSTTTVMTWLALRACGVDAVLCGNLFGSGYAEQPLTEAALNSTPDQVLVAEISSFQLEWISIFRPIAAGITNIAPDHLERYDSFEEYALTKQRIFAHQRAEDTLVVRAHDPVVTPPGRSGNAYVPRHRRVQSAPDPDAIPTILTFGAAGEHALVDELRLTILGTGIPLDQLPFREPHNLANAAMAALLAQAVLARRQGSPVAGLDSCVVEGLKGFRGLAHRMERVGERDGVAVINNSMCTNPAAVLSCLQAVKDPVRVLIGGRNKQLDFRPLGHYLANRRHHPYLFGEARGEIAEMLGGELPQFDTLGEAFRAAASEAVPGEILMLAPGCSSADQFSDFRERGDVFREMAKEWLSR